MTNEQLEYIDNLVDNATGHGVLDWWVDSDGGICCGRQDAPLEVGYTDMNEHDSELVLAAPVLLRKLVAEMERLRGETQRMTLERDEAHRLVREGFAELRKAVEKSTALRIAEDLESLVADGRGDAFGANVAVYRAIASRIRGNAWRTP